MIRSGQKRTQYSWSLAGMGFDANNPAVACNDIRIDPLRPAYPQISIFQIPDNQEVELLVCTRDHTWMKVRVFREDSHVWCMPYRTYQQTDMPDALAAIRQQSLGMMPVSPPTRESLSDWKDKFLRTYMLPELTDWDRAQAREWMEAQSIPGSAANLMHMRAQINNEAARRWQPFWTRFERHQYGRHLHGMAQIPETAEDMEGDRGPMPAARNSDLVVLDQTTEFDRPWGWWERAKDWARSLVWGDPEQERYW